MIMQWFHPEKILIFLDIPEEILIFLDIAIISEKVENNHGNDSEYLTDCHAMN